MPQDAVRDIRGSGTQRTKINPAAGPADSMRSRSAVNPTGILYVAGNQGTDEERTYGDGRKWTPVQPSTPASLVAGQYFIETYLGVEWFVFVDSAGNPIRLRAAYQPTTTSVPVGPAVVLASLSVDDYRYASYTYCAQSTSTGAQVSGVFAFGHNGTPGGDATIVQDNDVITVTIGSVALTMVAVLNGVGVAQVMQWTASATDPDWQISFTASILAET